MLIDTWKVAVPRRVLSWPSKKKLIWLRSFSGGMISHGCSLALTPFLQSAHGASGTGEGRNADCPARVRARLGLPEMDPNQATVAMPWHIPDNH
ncbi:MAG: hypothetical protein GY717_00465 [Rhodobacteraceae bacterium]|nr:hypothetical protein [Paracoccaceae bacterium]